VIANGDQARAKAFTERAYAARVVLAVWNVNEVEGSKL